MEWKQLSIWVYIEAVDPGIVHRESFLTAYKPEQLHEGDYLKYTDPSRGLSGLTVVAMDEKGLTLRVGKDREVRLQPGDNKELATGARDYSYFYLHAALEPIEE